MAVMTSEGRSQNLKTDSTFLPNTQLRTALRIIEKAKLQEEELRLVKEQNVFLYQRINVKDSVIRAGANTTTAYQSMVDNYEKDRGLWQTQVAIQSATASVLSKDLKRQKRKTFLVGLTGALSTAGLLYLLIK